MRHPLLQAGADRRGTAEPPGSAPLDSLKRGEAGRDHVLRKTCGTEKFPFLSVPCRNRGFWANGPWNGAEQGGKERNGAEHQSGGGAFETLSAPSTLLPRRTRAGRPGVRLRKDLRNLLQK